MFFKQKLMTMVDADIELVRPVLRNRHALCPDYRADLGDSKRLLERWVADKQFRADCRQDARAAARSFELRRDPEELRPLWAPGGKRACLHALGKDETKPLSLRRYCTFLLEKLQLVDQMREEGTPVHPAFRAWRRRQMLRCSSELAHNKGNYLVHAPFVVELGHGCSVGCWFCAVSAPKLGEQWPHTTVNSKLWKECLLVLQELLGETAARWGYCYWGTDPLDNPDYESFLLDFHEVLGAWPQTTTAQADRHVDRMKRILALGEERGGYLDRFSVVTLSQWQRIHDAFSPSEMTFVECPPQNKESAEPKAIAGRAFRANRKLAQRGREELVDTKMTSTIACVSGFLLNMVKREVSVVTPCNASERFVDGFWTLGKRSFHSGATLRTALLELIEECMPTSVGSERALAFRPDLDFSPKPDGFSLTDRRATRTFRGHDYLETLGRLLHSGGSNGAEISVCLADEHNLSWEESFYYLNEIFDNGLLNEQPGIEVI